MWSSRLLWKLLLVHLACYVVLVGGLLLVFSLYGGAEGRQAMVSRLAWVLAVGVGLIGIAATYVLVRRASRPLAALAAAAQTRAQTRSGRRIVIGRDDELSVLADAFQRMREEVDARADQLRRHGDQLTTVLGCMVEGVLAVDADQRILLANEASRNLLEITAEVMPGRALLETTRCRPVVEAVAKVLQTRRPFESEFESPSPRGRVLALRADLLPGTPAGGVLIVLRDITRLRRLEDMRREFVANVSHELKTPLASIKAYAETLRMEADPPDGFQAEFARRIEEQADRLHQLIVDLIQLARVESGQEAFEITDVVVGEVAARCIEDYAERARGKQLALRMEAPAEMVRVRADREGLRTILDNLMDNAVKYTPEGGRVVLRWCGAGDRVVIEVEDNGPGISPEDQQRVFERFYRVDRARSQDLGGTGLGLSIVKHLVQAFRGSVQLESELGRGSTFRVTLPAA